MPSMLRNGGGTWGFPCCGQQHHTTTVSRGGGASRPSEAAHSHSRLPPNGHRPMHTMHNMSIAAKSSCRLCCTIASLAWTRTQWYVLLRARIRRHTAAGRSLWAHRPRQRPRNTTRPVQSTPPPSTAGRFFFLEGEEHDGGKPLTLSLSATPCKDPCRRGDPWGVAQRRAGRNRSEQQKPDPNWTLKLGQGSAVISVSRGTPGARQAVRRHGNLCAIPHRARKP